MHAAYSLACSLLLILANTRRILIHGLIKVIRQGEFLLPAGLLVDFPVRGLVVSAAVVDLLAARAGLQARHGPADCAARTASSSAGATAAVAAATAAAAAAAAAAGGARGGAFLELNKISGSRAELEKIYFACIYCTSGGVDAK